MRNRLICLALFALLSFSLFAQPVRDALTIEVVDVPVYVTHGNEPLTSLDRDDFELFVNGKRQAIEYFDRMGTEGTKPDDATSLRERRLFVLMFDLAFTQPFSIGRAQRAAASVIAQASPNDLFAIATFSARRGVWFTTPFISDRVALARAVASLTTSASGDPLAIVLTPSERLALANWSLDSPDLFDSYVSRDGAINQLAANAQREIFYAQLRRAVEHQITDLTDLAGRLGNLQGQKHLVLLSEGFDGSGTSSASGVAEASQQTSGPTNSPGTLGLAAIGALRGLREMSRAFHRNDVLLHTLDLKGVHRMAGNDALFVLANETGGQFLHNRNDLGNALVDLTERVSNGYVIGFKPVAAKKGHNTIEVRVKNVPRGSQVRHRRGFSGTARSLDADEGLYLADVVLNDVPQTGTSATLQAANDALQVNVPLAPLAAQLGISGKADLMVYVFGANNVPLGYQHVVVDVPANASGEKAFRVDLPEGAKVAKALLRVDESVGFSRMNL